MGRADLAKLQGRLSHAIALNSAHHPVAARKAFTRLMAEIPTSSNPELLVLIARAHLGLATSRFDIEGDMEAALEHVAAAESLAREADAPQVLVAVHGQRGLLHLGAGQTEAALRSFDRAVPLLEHAEPFDRMRILLNRGALYLETTDLAAARRDLAACADLAAEAQDAVVEFKARHNLGYVEFLAGNLPAALSEMADAARLDYGGPWATALLDRARVLREAGLFTDADRLLEQARALYLADRMVQGAAETELVRA
jgi:tetratricopeptide (TPR) repeat protein